MVGPSDILKASVLIVDDQDANVRLLERTLKGAGYTAVTATMDPFAVCELHRNHRYDLILLDLQMPGMDGFQVMEGLKEIETGGYLPVLVITAQPDHKLRALRAGAKDFISKPFDLAEVLARVRNMLEVRLLVRELDENRRLMAGLENFHIRTFHLNPDGSGQFISGRPHPAFLFRAATGTIEELTSESTDPARAFQFNKGDILVVYSESLTDAQNQQQEAFGGERLRNLIQEEAPAGSGVLEEKMLEAIRRFTEGARQTGDITFVVVEKYQ